MHPVFRHVVEMWGLEEGVPHVAQGIESLIIDENQDDIARGVLGQRTGQEGEGH